jgi:hypothetical protein
MTLNAEVRESETRNRTATIYPSAPSFSRDYRYAVELQERGRLIKRTFKQRTRTLTEARRVSREWCK